MHSSVRVIRACLVDHVGSPRPISFPWPPPFLRDKKDRLAGDEACEPLGGSRPPGARLWRLCHDAPPFGFLHSPTSSVTCPTDMCGGGEGRGAAAAASRQAGRVLQPKAWAPRGGGVRSTILCGLRGYGVHKARMDASRARRLRLWRSWLWRQRESPTDTLGVRDRSNGAEPGLQRERGGARGGRGESGNCWTRLAWPGRGGSRRVANGLPFRALRRFDALNAHGLPSTEYIHAYVRIHLCVCVLSTSCAEWRLVGSEANHRSSKPANAPERAVASLTFASLVTFAYSNTACLPRVVVIV